MKKITKVCQETITNTGTPEMVARKHYFCRSTVLALAFSCVTVSLGVGNIAYANSSELLYSSRSFEPSIFPIGAQLLGLDGWSTLIPPFLNPAAATITDSAASHGHKSVVVQGGDLVGSGGLTDPYDAVGSYRRPLSHDMTAPKLVALVEADLLLKTDQQKTPGEFFSLTISARSGNGETLGELGLSSNGIVEAFPFDAAPGATPAFTKPIAFNRWYHLTIVLDFANRTTSYYLNNNLLGTISAPSISNNLSRSSMVVYARQDGGSEAGTGNTRLKYTARFDDFRVNVMNSDGLDRTAQEILDSFD